MNNLHTHQALAAVLTHSNNASQWPSWCRGRALAGCLKDRFVMFSELLIEKRNEYRARWLVCTREGVLFHSTRQLIDDDSFSAVSVRAGVPPVFGSVCPPLMGIILIIAHHILCAFILRTAQQL